MSWAVKMPAKRRTTRTAQLQPLPAQSDYDTDTAAITDTAASHAPPPQRTNTELNLTVLRRYVPDIEHIVAIAPFSAVYTFSPETQQWEKCGVEGTLFVCQLTGARYTVVIPNRKSLDNFITELLSADDVEITEQYVILQATGEDGTPQIYGLWIFSDESESQTSTREYIAQTIQSCAMQAQSARESASVADENGYSEEDGYGVDGTTQMQRQMGEEQAVSEQAGQRLDLLQLFGKLAVQPSEQIQNQPELPGPPQVSAQPVRFPSTADTDFFRGGQGQILQQAQQAQPPPQQNALLDLFKSAR